MLREEMTNLKDCVTSYVGLVLAGTGGATVALSAIDFNKSPLVPLGMAALLLGLVVALVLHVLVYKFYSHNRYAGYAKLLTIETHDRLRGRLNDGDPLIAWEFCVEGLRRCTSDRRQPWGRFRAVYRALALGRGATDGSTQVASQALLATLESVSVSGANVDNLKQRLTPLVGMTPDADRWAFLRGTYVVCAALFGHVSGGSWAFPPNVMAVFLIVTIALDALGLHAIVLANGGVSAWGQGVSSLGVVTLLTVQAGLWYRFLRRLHRLMNGSATVDAFCWSLLPLRARYLNTIGIEPAYRDPE